MKIAHLADLHLGFRQYDRDNAQGANQRSADVAESLRRAVDAVIAEAPDAVFIAGDVFNSVRPRNSAILFLFSELQRLRAAAPKADILMVAGDHDSPRNTIEGGVSILGLYAALGVRVVERRIERVLLAGGLSVVCVPKVLARAYRDWKPELAEAERPRGDLLLLHGEARHIPGAQLDAEFLDGEGFEYAALGHWHVCQQVAKRAWYPGSLDYVSSDVWGELREQEKRGLPGKGWLLVELDGAREPRVEFQPIAPARRYLDLPALDAEHMAPAEIDAELAARAADIDGAVVRQLVLNLSRETARELDHALIRERKGRALHYLLDVRRPAARDPILEEERQALRRRPLADIVDEAVSRHPLAPDLDRAAFRKLAQDYLAQAAAGTDGPAEDPYTGEPVGAPKEAKA